MYCIAKLRLAKDTRPIQTKTGTRMQTGFGFIDIDGDDGILSGVVAFGSIYIYMKSKLSGVVVSCVNTVPHYDLWLNPRITDKDKIMGYLNSAPSS